MNTSLLEKLEGATVEGACDPAWSSVLDAFILNFKARSELGASLCVTVSGQTKIDVWGGWANEERTKRWDRDTIGVIFSATKGATALCANILIDEGALDLHAPIARYWPEFARHGKDSGTVEMILNHSVGVPGFKEPLKDNAFADWDYMVHRIEEERPWWPPGQRMGYHGLTIGWLAGELVRRVSGKSLGVFFKERVADRLGLDFWIGLPEALEPRVSHMVPYKKAAGEEEIVTEFATNMVENPNSDAAVAMRHHGGYWFENFVESEDCYAPDTRLAHSAEIGAVGAITNARGLAGMYAPLANGGQGLISSEHIGRMSQVSMCAMSDAIMFRPSRFALGFAKGIDNRYRKFGHLESLIIGDRAFGHIGMGGHLGFADPDCQLSFGYTMNKMQAGLAFNPRGQSLVDAVYRQLGYRSDAAGFWAK
jgi:CubicO group peptidase (beta-lactamase class C family)